MSPSPVFVLGGYQTDFVRNLTREGKGTVDLFREVVGRAMETTGVSFVVGYDKAGAVR